MPKILVVGSPSLGEFNIPDVLSIAGYTVCHALDGKSAFQIVLEDHPDLIVSKTKLSLLDGLSFLHVVRRNAQLLLTPVIFISEQDNRDEVRRMMTAGADDCLAGKISDTELLYVVESRLKRVEGLKGIMEQNHNQTAGSVINERQVMEELLDGRSVHRFGKNQQIYNEGQSPKYLYFIKSGKVRIYKSSSEGKDLVTDLCGENDFIGYTALIQNTHYRESAESIDTAEVILIPRSEFQQLLRINLTFSYKFNQILASTLAHKNSHLVGIAYNSLRQKVAEALLQVKKKYASSQQENFAIHMNREVLANIAGTAKESLIRTLSEFKSEHLIEVGSDGNITIINEKKLQTLAGS